MTQRDDLEPIGGLGTAATKGGSVKSRRLGQICVGANRRSLCALARSEVILNLAEIADGKRIQNQQIFCIHIVDLVSGVTGYEQGPPRVDAVHHVLNGDRAAS